MGRLALLIELAKDADLAQIEVDVRRTLRRELSPRHVPGDVSTTVGIAKKALAV